MTEIDYDLDKWRRLHRLARSMDGMREVSYRFKMIHFPKFKLPDLRGKVF